MTAPYLAPSLAELRAEINKLWPKRDKSTDGWLGDAAHAARKSEHNPNGHGAVTAIDIDKDGIDLQLLLKTVIKDPRVWYVIHNRIIYSRTYGWAARRYTGANPHLGHVHISLVQNRASEDNTAKWFDSMTTTNTPKPTPKPVPKPTPKPAPPFKDYDHAPASRTLREGSKGDDVKYLQRWLNLKADGIFGPKTAAAVKHYQKSRKLTVDAIVGDKTWNMILHGK